MEIVKFQHQRDEDGRIVYGHNPLGLFVISGNNGPECMGWPGLTLVDGMLLAFEDDGRIHPYVENESS